MQLKGKEVFFQVIKVKKYGKKMAKFGYLENYKYFAI